MNKKIIITLTVSIILGGSSAFFAIHYHSKKTESLNVNVIEKQEQEEENKEEEKVKSEQKEENNEENNNEEMTVPWLYTWKGEVLSLLVSIIIGVVVFAILSFLEIKRKVRPENPLGFNFLFYAFIFVLVFESVIFPSLFAIKKFGKKSYFQRFKKIFSKGKVIVVSIIIAIIIIYFCFVLCFLWKNSKEEDRKIKKILIYFFTAPFHSFKKPDPNMQGTGMFEMIDMSQPAPQLVGQSGQSGQTPQEGFYSK